ncbi:Na+/H+ antiporter NhaA [Streptomyces pactum]|uniref:Na+/H+ antiporter NhaA n=2 Tax=Streptomyces pactum TaxID=68249 RepID=A0ABS0NTD1_9ACTN|nr:Na+/H+ antiporter NhaA [Streptomyces pactum]
MVPAPPASVFGGRAAPAAARRWPEAPAGTCLAARFTRARLDPDLARADVPALAVPTGIGFTVAPPIGEPALPADAEAVEAAVLTGSLIAAVCAGVLPGRRNGIHRRLYEEENRDEDADGIPVPPRPRAAAPDPGDD